MNKTGGSKTITTIMILLLVVVVIAVAYFIYSDTQAKKLEQEQIIIREEAPAVGLTGKPGTLSVFALDKSNSDKTTKAAGQLYVITDPVITADKITGGFSTDGTLMSTTVRTSVTTGITVGTKFAAIASNSTYFGFPTTELTFGTSNPNGDGYSLNGVGQSQTLDIDVYKTAPTINLKMYEGLNEVKEADISTFNFSIGADQVAVPDTIDIEMNLTNVAVNLAGFYIDLPADTNISSIEIQTAGSEGLAESTLNLVNTETDDYVFEFSSPILMLPWDKLTLTNALKFTGSGTGCTGADDGDLFTFYMLDKIWYKSADESAMKYMYETDASTSEDIGMGIEVMNYSCAPNS